MVREGQYLYSSNSQRRSKHAVLILTVGWVVWVWNFWGTGYLQEHIDQGNKKTGGLYDKRIYALVVWNLIKDAPY